MSACRSRKPSSSTTKSTCPATKSASPCSRSSARSTFREFRISAEHGTGLEELRNAIYQSLDVVRVYTKLPTKKEADYDKPFTLKRGGTLLDVAELVHRDIAANFKYARVWGTAVLAGTQMKGDYVVHDKDVVEIHA